MKISNIQVSNFKSFDDCQVILGDFNVIIGANASGKSNFVQIFRFIRDIARDGLENAISLQGGIEYFRNINLVDKEDFFLKFTLIPKNKILNNKPDGFRFLINQVDYQVFWKMELQFEELIQTTEEKIFLELEEKRPNIKLEKMNYQFLSPNKIEINNSYKNFKISPPDKDSEQIKKFLHLFNLSSLDFLELLKFINPLENHFLFIDPTFRNNILSDFIQEKLKRISIFDIEPKLPKKIFTVNSKLDLEEDGSNLVILLKKVLANPEKQQSLINLVSYVIPSINNLEIEKIANNFLMFSIEEKYKNKNYPIPSSLLSDGTINVIAIILALYFNKPNADSLIIIEEPEKNIHPHVMSKIVEMMKEVSKDKQIIVTTHSPEIVKYAGIENLLLMTRNQEGFSQIVRPADSEEVQIFLKNEIGIEDLYTQNLLDMGV